MVMIECDAVDGLLFSFLLSLSMHVGCRKRRRLFCVEYMTESKEVRGEGEDRRKGP